MTDIAEDVRKWHNATWVERWKAEQRAGRKTRRRADTRVKPVLDAPLLQGIARRAIETVSEAFPALLGIDAGGWDGESLAGRLARLGRGEPAVAVIKVPPLYRIPFSSMLLTHGSEGEVLFTDYCRRHATEWQIIKAAVLWGDGLKPKAYRQLSCRVFAGIVKCTAEGTRFSVPYACGLRYCRECGPQEAKKLFARIMQRISGVDKKLVDAGSWVTRARIDFTVVNTGSASAESFRQLNRWVRKFFKACVRRGWIPDNKSYGAVWCDELGGENTNMHAHCAYTGPFLPQRHRECSELWDEITGFTASGGKQGGKIVYIQQSRSLGEALYHALKYPAKFADKSTPEWSAALEAFFHGVRRVHSVGAFYNPEHEDSKPGGLECPDCGALCVKDSPLLIMEEIERQGLEDIEIVRLRVNRERANPPP